MRQRLNLRKLTYGTQKFLKKIGRGYAKILERLTHLQQRANHHIRCLLSHLRHRIPHLVATPQYHRVHSLVNRHPHHYRFKKSKQKIYNYAFLLSPPLKTLP